MSFEPREYLRHILAEADYLIMADDTLQRAFVRSLEIIGAATKKIPDEFRGIRWLSGARWRECALASSTTISAWTTACLGRRAKPHPFPAGADRLYYRRVADGCQRPLVRLASSGHAGNLDPSPPMYGPHAKITQERESLEYAAP
jgi:hypothetical protein